MRYFKAAVKYQGSRESGGNSVEDGRWGKRRTEIDGVKGEPWTPPGKEGRKEGKQEEGENNIRAD